jgi:hypothetical protein
MKKRRVKKSHAAFLLLCGHCAEQRSREAEKQRSRELGMPFFLCVLSWFIGEKGGVSV